MIKRIFKVTIIPEYRAEFERDFSSISVNSFQSYTGFISYVIGTPSKWNPDEYLMETIWKDEASLINYAGKNWNTSVIPDGMHKYATCHSVEHFIV